MRHIMFNHSTLRAPLLDKSKTNAHELKNFENKYEANDTVITVRDELFYTPPQQALALPPTPEEAEAKEYKKNSAALSNQLSGFEKKLSELTALQDESKTYESKPFYQEARYILCGYRRCIPSYQFTGFSALVALIFSYALTIEYNQRVIQNKDHQFKYIKTYCPELYLDAVSCGPPINTTAIYNNCIYADQIAEAFGVACYEMTEIDKNILLFKLSPFILAAVILLLLFMRSWEQKRAYSHSLADATQGEPPEDLEDFVQRVDHANEYYVTRNTSLLDVKAALSKAIKDTKKAVSATKALARQWPEINEQLSLHKIPTPLRTLTLEYAGLFSQSFSAPTTNVPRQNEAKPALGANRA